MRRTDYWFVLNTMYSRKIPERRYEIPEEFAGRLWSKVTRKAQSFSQASFICAGALAFSLGALSWNYGTYTWQTNCDTFNKISFDDLKNNATLTAMLVYLASEDPERVPRERRNVMSSRGGPSPLTLPSHPYL